MSDPGAHHPPAPVADQAPARPARRGAVPALVAGIALVVLGAFLPWVISGATTRSSFATVRTADRLGVVPDGAALLVLRVVLVPLAAALVPLLLVLHRVVAAAVVAILLAALTGLIATIVLIAAPERGSGPVVCLVGGVLVLVGAVALLVHRRRISRHLTSSRGDTITRRSKGGGYR